MTTTPAQAGGEGLALALSVGLLDVLSGVSQWHIEEGNSLEIAPHIDRALIGGLVSDPPYGINHPTDYSRFTGTVPARDYKPVLGDDKEFDPTPWIDYAKVSLFGFHRFSNKVPPGGILIWCKRRDSKLGMFLSDAEIAWTNYGHGVYMMRYVWDGFDREDERGTPRRHPTQKPVTVMRWIIEHLRIPKGAIILDPYCGTGPTGVAALQLGYRFIGIDLDGEYCDIARGELSAAHRLAYQPHLFTEIGA